MWRSVARAGHPRLADQRPCGRELPPDPGRREARGRDRAGRGAGGLLDLAGVNAEVEPGGGRIATDAETAGADALLVFPPNSWGLHHDAGMAEAHHAHVERGGVAAAGALPGPGRRRPHGLSAGVIEALVRSPRVVAIKEGSWEVRDVRENRRLVSSAARHRGDGLGRRAPAHQLHDRQPGRPVSLAAIVPELIATLHEAAMSRDWNKAREIHERIYPLSVAIYRRAPGNRATARLKTCLKLLGRLEHDTARPPIQPLPPEEIAELRAALKSAGL